MKTMIAALVAAFPLAAGAATMGTIPVGGEVTAANDGPGPQKWTVDLERGRIYAMSSLSYAAGNVSIHAAGGTTIASYQMAGEDGWHGTSFRAPYTGRFIVQVACRTDGGVPPCPGSYDLAALHDCPGDATTRCSLAVGATLRGQSLFGAEDVDQFRTTLRVGRTYQIAVAADQPGPTQELCLALRDAGGALVATTDCETGFALSFTPAASGNYYAEVRQGGTGAPGRYAISMSQGH